MDAMDRPTWDAGARGEASGPRPWQAFVVVAASVALMATAGPLLISAFTGRYAGLALVEVLCVGAPVLFVARAGRHDLRFLFRLRRPRGGVLLPVAMMAGGGFALAQSCGEWMERALGPGWSPDLERFRPAGLADTAVALAVLGVVPAVAEELLFRGYLLRGIERMAGIGVVRACLISGAVFAAAHMSPVLFLSQMFLGGAITLVVIRADSIYPGMLLHALNNACAVVLWGTPLLRTLPDSVAANAAAALSFAGGVALLRFRTPA